MIRTEEETPRPLIEEISMTPVDSKGALVVASTPDPLAPEPEPLWRRAHDFPALVLLPLALAAYYLFAFACDLYVSETKYIIRSGAANTLASVASLVQTQGLSRATDDIYVVNEFVRSRDIVRLLAENDGLRAILNRPEADALSRYPNFYARNDSEGLYLRYRKAIEVSLDESSGISTLRAIGFRADDAKALATAVMKHADTFINKLNDRAHDDQLKYAQMIVDKARQKVADVEARLTLFRNEHGIVNPAQESLAALKMISHLSEEQAQLEAALGRQIALTPSSPAIESVRNKIQSYKDEIAKLRARVVGSDTSTASAMSAYDSLMLERELAAKALEVSLVSFEHARGEAEQKHLYIETVAQPSSADFPEYPRRALCILLVALVAVGFWIIQRSLRISAAEHGL